MKFKFTNSSEKILERIKARILDQFEKQKPQKFRIKYTKKRYFLVVPLPLLNPAFQLYIDDKFYKSYYFKNKVWLSLQ